ncbi:MAG: hypothetical protein OXL36_21710 [Bryobacterales bacterium]|nr:hypothetical protein [Bryobacterales bacterium]
MVEDCDDKPAIRRDQGERGAADHLREVGRSMNGARMRGEGFPDGIFYHWVWAHVKGSKVFLTVKEIDGPMGQGRMFKAEDWDSMNGGPAFNIADPALSIHPET